MDNEIVWLTALALVLSGCGGDSSTGDGSILSDAGVAGFTSPATQTSITGGTASAGGRTSVGGLSSAAGANAQGGNGDASGGSGAAPLGGTSGATPDTTVGGTTAMTSSSSTVVNGGAAVFGGSSATAGSNSAGGVVAAGGTSTATTRVSTGGSSTPGSTASTGGHDSFGGTSASGSMSAGGTQDSGGALGTAGVSSAGGALVIAGAASTGGVQQVGGSSASSTCANVYYRDADGDSWGTQESSCSGGAGWVTRTGDCNDANEDVFPSQTKTFAIPYATTNGHQSFDYDCDGTETATGGVQASTGQCEASGLGNACLGDGYLPVEPPRTGEDINQLCGSARYLVCARSQQQCVGAVATDQDAVACR